jgi:tetratricopeptide (TPR) repeat protein
LQLLIADFRVLRFISDELRQQFDSSESTIKENAALQLAVCHSIGFGARKNNIQSQSWLERSGRTKEALQIELNLIREDHRWVTDDLKFRQMDGTLGLLDSRLRMRDAEVIKNAENHYRALIEDLSGVLPETHIMRMQSRYILASVLQRAGNNAEAKQLYSDLAKDMASSRWGPSHQSTIDMHVRSAAMSYNMGAYAECEELLRIALAQQVENVPETHQDVLIIKVALAAVLNDLSKLEEAEGFARSAAEKYLEKLGSSHPQTQGAMGVLANILLTRGKLVEAEKILESTAKTLAEVVGKENAELVTIRSNLALIYARQGRLTAAEKLLEELQQEITNTVGISHPDSIFLLGNLAVTSHDIGKKDRAIVIYQQILQRSDVIGANHPYLLTVKANLASALINDRRYQESAKLLDDALEKQTSIYGRNNTSTLSTMSILAKLFQAQGKYQAAKELYNIVLKGKEVTLGRNHPSVHETLANLALVVRELGDVSSAFNYSRESVNALEAGLGLQHPSTLMATMNLATIMVASGDLLDAISTFSSVLCRTQEILGEAHPDSILAMNHLARTYHLHHEHKKSKECYLLALRLEFKIGSDHTRILSVKHNLGLLLYDLGEFHGAEKVFSEAVSGRRKVLGDDHYDTLESSYSLALALYRLRKTATALQLLQGVAYRKEQTLGEGNEETWRSFGSLALMFHDTGHYKHSSDVRIHQLALMSKKLPDNHADILASRQALAESLREQKQFSEAAEILREVVGKRQSLFHQDDPQILATRYSLGLVQFCQCKFQEADTNLCEVLKAYDGQGLTENEGALDVAHTLGMIQHRMGKLEQSQHSFLRAMEGRRKLPGREPRVYESLMCLALVSRDMTQMAKAIAQAEEAWSGIQKYLGPAHHLTTHSLLNLISLFLFEEKIDRAVRVIESYLEAMGEELGWADRRILDMGKKPVLMVFRFGETKRAIKLMKSIHEGYQKELSGIANLVRECEEELRKMESGDSKV